MSKLKEAKKEEVKTISYSELQELSKIVADINKKTEHEDVRIDFYNIIIYFPRTIKYVYNEELCEYDLLDENCGLPKKIFNKIVDYYETYHKIYFDEGEIIRFTDSQELYTHYFGRITDNADYNNLTVRCYLMEKGKLINMGFKDISVEGNNVKKVTDYETIRIINKLIDDLKFDDNDNIIIMPDNTVDMLFEKVNHVINIVDNTDIEQSDNFRVLDNKGIEYTIDISMTKTDIISVVKEQILNRVLNYGTYSILNENEEIASVEVKRVY